MTLNAKSEIIGNGYLLIEEERIVEIGCGDCPAEPNVAKVVDLYGCIVIPGLVNAHSHSYSNLVKGTTENLPLELWMLFVGAEGKALTKEDVRLSSLLGSIEMLKGGVTCFLDHLAQPAPALKAAAEAYEEVGIRACVTPMFSDKPYSTSLPPAMAASTRFSDGVALDVEQNIELLEESLQIVRECGPRVSAGIGPSGPQRCSDRMLLKSYEVAEKYDLPWHTHVLETRIQRETAKEFYQQGMIEYLDALGILSPRCSLAHVVWPSEEETRLLGEKDVTVVHNPTSNAFLGSGIAPVIEMKESGVRIAIGTDGANCNGNLSMFEAMKLAAILSNVGTEDFRRWIRARDVLEMSITHGSEALNLNQKLGSLEAGKEADFVVINSKFSGLVPLNELLWQLVYGRTDMAVNDVYVAGDKVVENGKVVTVSEEDVYEEAIERGSSLLNRLESKYGSIRARQGRIEESILAVLGGGDT